MQAQQWHEHHGMPRQGPEAPGLGSGSQLLGSAAAAAAEPLAVAAAQGAALAGAAAVMADAAGAAAEAGAVAAAGAQQGDQGPGDPEPSAQQEAADAVFAALWRAQQAAAAAAHASGAAYGWSNVLAGCPESGLFLSKGSEIVLAAAFQQGHSSVNQPPSSAGHTC